MDLFYFDQAGTGEGGPFPPELSVEEKRTELAGKVALEPPLSMSDLDDRPEWKGSGNLHIYTYPKIACCETQVHPGECVLSSARVRPKGIDKGSHEPSSSTQGRFGNVFHPTKNCVLAYLRKTQPQSESGAASGSSRDRQSVDDDESEIPNERKDGEQGEEDFEWTWLVSKPVNYAMRQPCNSCGLTSARRDPEDGLLKRSIFTIPYNPETTIDPVTGARVSTWDVVLHEEPWTTSSNGSEQSRPMVPGSQVVLDSAKTCLSEYMSNDEHKTYVNRIWSTRRRNQQLGNQSGVVFHERCQDCPKFTGTIDRSKSDFGFDWDHLKDTIGWIDELGPIATTGSQIIGLVQSERQ